jgi:hypothetical protein
MVQSDPDFSDPDFSDPNFSDPDFSNPSWSGSQFKRSILIGIPILVIPILAIPILAMSSRNLTTDIFKKKCQKWQTPTFARCPWQNYIQECIEICCSLAFFGIIFTP